MSVIPGETAVIVAFFGWDRYSPSATTGTSTPGNSLSRMSSGLATPSTSTSNRVMITCELCQRQVGLWTFTAASKPTSPETPSAPGPQRVQKTRQFDVLKEHRPHCPYVVKTTYLPTISLPSKEIGSIATVDSSQTSPFVEGWKALMSVISRSQWRRTAGSVNPFGGPSNNVLDTPRSETGNEFSFETVPNEVDTDQVSEIVKDVRSRHGGVRIIFTSCSFTLCLLFCFYQTGKGFIAICQGPFGLDFRYDHCYPFLLLNSFL
jgi:Rsm1-like